ncbi:MAG: MBL fold metallo-hydrolase [Cyclobacteriaceae bacterium]
MKHFFVSIPLILLMSCGPTEQPHVDLVSQQWIHGSVDCGSNSDPAIQVVQYNRDTWILRQNKCTNAEAPFMFLFLGEARALLMDTGATDDPAIFPLYETISTILSEWNAGRAEPVTLVVAHTHKHGDHYAADGQFVGKDNVSLVGLEVADIQAYFGIRQWPEEMVDFDLGERTVQIIPIPGHEEASIALYDESTGWLLTGDTFYPGRLYVKDWMAFKSSIARLVEFSHNNKIEYILGNHIEMSSTPGRDYKMGTLYQPNELPLPLTIADLEELHMELEQLGDIPARAVRDKFIIYPLE